MDERHRVGRQKLRSVFLSDIHLGSRYSQAESLLDFLNAIQPEHLYLVGDIIDGWRLKHRWHWRPVFNQILPRLLELGRSGTQVRFTPGNHDAFFREFTHDFGFLEIADTFCHHTADGRRFLVLHGDRFDDVELRTPWLSYVGSWAYETLLWLDAHINQVRSLFGCEQHSFSADIKRRVKQAVMFVSRFEQRLRQAAFEAGCDGVICGHVHTPAVSLQQGLAYFNTGDWIEHRTALVEHDDGRMEIVHLPRRPFEAMQAAVPRSLSAGESSHARSDRQRDLLLGEPLGAS